MSILSALSDSGLAAVGNVVFPLTFPELMIGEDEDSHVALFDMMDRWYDDGSDWDHTYTYDDAWDDIEAAKRYEDRMEEMKAAWLRGEEPWAHWLMVA